MQETVGRYRILRPLGRGAMGLVFLAEDPSLNRQVAIKMLDILTDSEGDREFLRTRLLRDAKAAAILSHPNIVSVFDIVEEGTSVYVVMEYIEGESLAAHLDNTPIPDSDFTLRVLRQVAAGLDYTHSRGIVHRDIKPGNIMIGPNGVVKILDFGIARISDVRTSTPTGLVMGTVDYMAPEQIKAAMIDGRADQFSLAAVAYRMISGSTLFGRHTLATLTYKLVNESPPSVCEQNSALPAAVDHVLTMALAKSPSDRYPSCSAFVEALTAAFSGTPVLPTPTVAVPKEAAVAATGANRSKAAAMVAGVVLLAAGVGGIAWWKPWDRSASPVEKTAVVASIPGEKPAEKPAEKPVEESPKPPVKKDAVVHPPATPPVMPPATPKPKPAVKAPVPVKPTVTPPPVEAKAPEKMARNIEPAAKPKEEVVPPPPPPPPPAVKEPEVAMNTPDSIPTQPEPIPPTARETPLKKAQEAMDAKDYAAAIRSFNKVIEMHPNMVQAYVGRGLAHQMSGRIPKATQDYSDAIRLGTKDPHAYANRGVCEVRSHEDDLALADFNRALELMKKFPVALNGRGGIYYRRKQYKLAIEDFSAAIRIDPNFLPAYQNRENARKATHDLAGAADDYVVIQRLQRK